MVSFFGPVGDGGMPAVAHVHAVFPYFYVKVVGENAVWDEDGIYALGMAIEQAYASCYHRARNGKKKGAASYKYMSEVAGESESSEDEVEEGEDSSPEAGQIVYNVESVMKREFYGEVSTS